KGIYSIDKIIDFYGIRPFKNAGIDPVIIFIKNENLDSNKIQVIKPKNVTGDKKGLFYKSLFLGEGEEYNSFCIDKNILSDGGWILRDERERKIINKIEKKCFTNLSNICTSYQGIITGCDKAFIISKDEVKDENIELNLLKTWIKSSYIKKKSIKNSDKFIIYSDIISNKNEFPNAINHIEKFKDKLLKRRECQKGIRKWYNLQWGRKKEIFEGKKIVFPYKSESNRFALDVGSFFSADIYALVLKDNVPFTYEYLLYILNSDIYEFYFKTFAKKLGENMYEYYPNTIMKLCIPIMSENVNENYLYNMFEFDEEDIRIIKESVKNEQDVSK
ncbi:MAG: TaqI-like C-terminal specificity domain-containing protein, partial [Clostridium sp.]|nr:TaqI-like C-terminal specificity domain-containing protein [Clostridium sp.]